MNDQMPPIQEPKKNNTVLIAVIVVVVLCCCCLTIAGLWQYGDAILQAMG